MSTRNVSDRIPVAYLYKYVLKSPDSAVIVMDEIAGDSRVVIWWVEFQSRGLPHIHCKVTLRAGRGDAVG